MLANGRIRPLWPVLLSILLALLVSGCSESETNSGLSLVDEQGEHPAGFLANHPTFAVSSVDQCRSCHGENLAGGIANTSCFTAACHHGTIPGWVAAPPAAQPHGSSAKGVLPGSFGFVSCQICHGDSFSGGGAQKPCLNAACHGGPGTTPHPSQWRSGDTYFHTTTEERNASVCARCHLNGNNSPIGLPDPPAPAGTAPDCFNNTLCHGENPVPHPLGDPAWWTTPPAAQPHGNSAKTAPGASSGFTYCRVCHGTSDGNFNGGSAQVSCLNTAGCHGAGVQSPHPSQWFQGDTYQHITTDPGNAPACAFCHYNEPNAGNHPPTPPPAGSNPGCFNGTLCHGASLDVHSTGWFVRPPGTQPHGQSAKGTVSGLPGFEFCRQCHGTPGGNFTGGSVQFSCLIADCHGGTGSSPHAAEWLPGNTYVHTTTDLANAPECGFCHYGESGGGNHPPTPPPAGSGCFNGTLCHASVTPAGTHTTGWLDPDSAAFHGSLVGSISCENASCHPISGHPTCTTCHFTNTGSRANTSLSPPFAHDGNVFSNHREGSYSSVGNVCENCHQTSRTFRAGAPPSGCGPTRNHPGNEGCHYDASLLDPVLTNPRF